MKINRKGFTLVEVLAVVTILSIVALLITQGIMGYFKSGKDDYNNKLQEQLRIAGKSYFTNHRTELPNSVNGKRYAYVTLAEIQSNNYVTKSFIDSEGRECTSLSYVHVRQKDNNPNEYEYTPCLICQDENGKEQPYNDSLFCKISNWEDKTAPTCGTQVLDYADSSKFYLSGLSDIDNANSEGKFSGIQVEKNVGSLRTTYQISTGKNNITKEEMERVNIKELLKNDKSIKLKENEAQGGTYTVKVVDASGNISDDACMTFNPCSLLNDESYEDSGPIYYGGQEYTVVEDNGDSVSLALNGTSGGGPHANSFDSLTKFIDNNGTLKISKNNGCLINQGSAEAPKYATVSNTEKGYDKASYWLGADEFYNNVSRTYYEPKYTSYVFGVTAKRMWQKEKSDIEAKMNTLTDTLSIYTVTTGVTPRSTAAGRYSTSTTDRYELIANTGQIQFKNYSYTTSKYSHADNSSNKWSTQLQEYIIDQHLGAFTQFNNGTDGTTQHACDASSTIICGRNYRYNMKYNPDTGKAVYTLKSGTQQNGENTTKSNFYICGGKYNNQRVTIKAKSSTQFTLTTSKPMDDIGITEGNKNYRTGDNNKLFHTFLAGTYKTSCGDPKVGCSEKIPYIRDFYMNNSDSGSCQGNITEYNMNPSYETLQYRPYIIVKKEK